MISYLTRNQLLEKAYKSFVPLQNQKAATEAVADVISQHLTYLKGLDSGLRSFEMPNPSMLVVGRTGCGKSEIVKRLASVCGLPFASLDASALSAEGWKGLSLNEALKNAIENSTDPLAFKKDGGLVLVDEIDKLTFRYHHTDQRASNPQQNFLKAMEKDYLIQGEQRIDGHYEVFNLSSERILFIFAGAFSGIETQLKAKYGKSEIGFSSRMLNSKENQETDYYRYITMHDIEDFGILGELLGRIGSLTYIPPLTLDDYITLVKGGANSMESRFGNIFKLHGVEFSIQDEACKVLGREAEQEKLGARGLSAILTEKLRPAFIEIDNRPDINEVLLITQNGELKFEYRTGIRKEYFKEFNSKGSISPHIPDIERYLNNEYGCIEVSSKLADEADFANAEYKEAFYYIINAFCHYLRLECNEEDRNFVSIQKLAKCLDESTGKSTFDIMIETCFSRFERIEGEYETLQSAYQRYKELAGADVVQAVTQGLNHIIMKGKILYVD